MNVKIRGISVNEYSEVVVLWNDVLGVRTGVIVKVGERVSTFKPGDEVYGRYNGGIHCCTRGRYLVKAALSEVDSQTHQSMLH